MKLRIKAQVSKIASPQSCWLITERSSETEQLLKQFGLMKFEYQDEKGRYIFRAGGDWNLSNTRGWEIIKGKKSKLDNLIAEHLDLGKVGCSWIPPFR